jgi:putative FmdB family regulatory protein
MRYDFLCNQCDEIFEVVKRHDDETPVVCPICDSTDVRKLILTTPMFFISWRNSMGLGHSGQIVLPAVQNKREQDRRALRDSDRRQYA